jgi:hypothetical protein
MEVIQHLVCSGVEYIKLGGSGKKHLSVYSAIDGM